MAPDSVSDDGLNIYRGILNVLELSIKKMQHSYSLQEVRFLVWPLWSLCKQISLFFRFFYPIF